MNLIKIQENIVIYINQVCKQKKKEENHLLFLANENIIEIEL